jgi:HK97 family phage major capsid protein
MIRAAVVGPKTDLERRALAEGTDSAGGFSVPDIVMARFIDKMRAATVTVRAGAQTVPLTSDRTTVVRIATDPVAAWRVENAAIAVSDPTYEGVILTPRVLAVIVKVSRELIEDSLNIESMLEASFAGSMAVELDRVALVGSGVAPEPSGISNTANVGAVAAGGALTSYDKLCDAVYEILVDNGAMPTAMVMPPRTTVALAKLKTGLTSDNTPLVKPPLIADIPILTTTSLPITEAPGTASRIIMGDFSRLMIGIRSALRVEVLRELYAGNHQYGFVAHLRADVAVEHPESFSQITGIVP